MKYSHDIIYRSGAKHTATFKTKRESDRALERAKYHNFRGVFESITVYPTNQPWKQTTYRFRLDGTLY